ncbi:MAG: hypothetical protein Q7S27_01965 [Nanoarchaeota archaeon]|nr:hypothetical protein [Nanoarchaeota archaeon]
MTLLRYKDIAKMSRKDKDEKFKELKFSLYKGNVTANKASAKTKEIKRALARILTFNTANKGVLKAKK